MRELQATMETEELYVPGRTGPLNHVKVERES